MANEWTTTESNALFGADCVYRQMDGVNVTTNLRYSLLYAEVLLYNRCVWCAAVDLDINARQKSSLRIRYDYTFYNKIAI